MNRRIQVVLAVSLLVVVACTDDDAELSATTSVVAGTTQPGSDGGTSTTSTTAPDETSTTLRGQAVTQYTTVHTEETANGQIRHLLIPRAGYTDIDIESFVRDLREATPGLWGLEIFDNDEAQEAFLVPAADRDDDQRALVNAHHLASLSEGDTLVWRGPFSLLGSQALGS